MIFPSFLKPNDLIGVTACSDGLTRETDVNGSNNARAQLKKHGFQTILTQNVYKSEKGRSSDAATRAFELDTLVTNKAVKAIIAATGGDYLLEMLPYVNYSNITANPKWFQGYSDPTGLLFGLTTKYDIATIYSYNFTSFGMEPWDKSLDYNLEILTGKPSVQKSFTKYQANFKDMKTGLEPFDLDTPVEWKPLNNEKELSVSGRMIAGCLDVILDLVGTPYEDVSGFINRYKNDGILWFLESFSLDSERLTIALWHLRELGWFSHASGIVFGRPCFFGSSTDTTFEEAVKNTLGSLNIPIITGADVGHRKPSISIVSGALGNLRFSDNTAQLTTVISL